MAERQLNDARGGQGNQGGPRSSSDRSLPRAVERHARERGARVAVVCGHETLSYAELDARANRIARRLRRLGVSKGTLVGLCLPRGAEFVAALLGILKSGAAYLPLDPDYPAERLRRIAGRSTPTLIVTIELLRERLAPGTPVLCVDRDAASIAAESATECGVALGADDLCYVIFTSGSTGEPKGVMVTHGNVARLFDDIGAALALGPDDVWSQLHASAFGFSVFEIWGALTHGACLAVAPAAVRGDGPALRNFLEGSRVSVLSQTPTALRETVLTDAFAGAWPALAVRAVVLSGEAVLAKDLERWSDLHALQGPRLLNTYAITETGGNVMLREYLAGDLDARNIGRPLADVAIHVLDARHEPVPSGEPGELHVGGPGIAAGYLDDAALTAARFIELPHGARAYRTGDRVRVVADGSLEFLGRVDDQVKWRGHRLELGEIESLLRTHPGVSAAAAAIRAAADGTEKLVAYVVPGGAPGALEPAATPAALSIPGSISGSDSASAVESDRGSDVRSDVAQDAVSEMQAELSPKLSPEFWPSLGGYQIYDEFLYALMSGDALRNAAFRAAFERHARDRIVLDLGTGPHALLARFAADAGARKVYAVEVLAEAAANAAAVVRDAGLAERIEVIAGDAAGVQIAEPAEVCTQGIVGNIGGADGIARIWNRARKQLAPGCVPVPARCTTLIAAVELPEPLRTTPAFAPLALDYVRKIFASEGRAFDVRLCIRNLPPAQVLSDRHVFEDLDFAGELPEQGSGRARFTLARAGRFDGFLLWTVIALDGEAQIDYLEHQHAWLPVFMPLPNDGVELAAGTVIDAHWEWGHGSDELCPDYAISASFAVGGPIECTRYVSRHHESAHGTTAIHRRLLAPQAAAPAANPPSGLAPGALRAWLARHLPEPLLPNAWMVLDALPLSPNGKLDRRALPAPAERTWGGHGGAPQTALESDLAALWSEILGVAAVGLQDNFFDLGGDSIAAVRLTTRIQQLLDDGVMLAAVFEAPTLSTLARYLSERHRDAVAARYGEQRSRVPGRGGQRGTRRTHGEL